MKALHFAIDHRTTGTQKAAAGAHIRYITRTPDAAGEHAAYVTRTRGYVREDLIATGTGNLPAWAEGSPVRFFEAADQYERGGVLRPGRTATQITAALPRDLTHAQQQDAVQDFVQGQLGTRHAYVWGIHETVASDGKRYPHVHMAFSERTDTGQGLGPEQYFSQRGYHKDRVFNDRAWPQAARQAWSDTLNATLEQAGAVARVDARTFRAQGFDRDGAEYVKRQDVREHPEKLQERPPVADTPEMQQRRAAAWEDRKQVLGLSQGMTREEVVQRIRDASHEAIATHQAQRRQLVQALGSDAGAVAQRLASVQEARQEAQRLTWDEQQYVRHPEQSRSMQHLVAMQRLLQQADEEVPGRKWRVHIQPDEGQRRSVGYGVSE